MKCGLCCGTGEIVEYFLKSCAECSVFEQRLQNLLNEINAHFAHKEIHRVKKRKTADNELYPRADNFGQVQQNYPTMFHHTEYQNANVNHNQVHTSGHGILIPQIFHHIGDQNLISTVQSPQVIHPSHSMMNGYVKINRNSVFLCISRQILHSWVGKTFKTNITNLNFNLITTGLSTIPQCRHSWTKWESWETGKRRKMRTNWTRIRTR